MKMLLEKIKTKEFLNDYLKKKKNKNNYFIFKSRDFELDTLYKTFHILSHKDALTASFFERSFIISEKLQGH
jgi:hypothetical protein